jgi:hypothetical protein
MEYYKETYKDSKLWNGEPTENKILIVYFEQGLGDAIQFFRYIFKLKYKKIYLHCDLSLHRLFENNISNCKCLNKYNPVLPEHDYHILSLDLPFLTLKKRSVDIQDWWIGKKAEKYMPQIIKDSPNPPYIHHSDKIILDQKTGVCWQGSPNHENDADRSCSEELFEKYLGDDLVGLVPSPAGIVDFYDTATVINSVESVITVDTAVLHLAGAMNKPTFGLLGKNSDARWGEGEKTYLYPSVTFLRNTDGWEDLLKRAAKSCPSVNL